MLPRVRQWWPTVVWMSVIFGTSCTVISSQEWTRTVATRGPIKMKPQEFAGFWDRWWWLFVKGYHVLEYAILTILLVRSLHGRLAVVAGIALAYAASDEYHQTFISGRGGRWTDVAIDFIGIALVSAAVWFAERKRALKGK